MQRYMCCPINQTLFQVVTDEEPKKIKVKYKIPFMGLRDKNGCLIYFGDILKDDFDNLLTPVCEISNGEHVLFFKPLHHLNKKIGIGCKSTYSYTLEIIGRL